MRKIKFSCGPRAGKSKKKPTSPLPKMNIQQKTVVTANLSGERAHRTSECNLTSDASLFPKFAGVCKSVLPPTGCSSLWLFMTLTFFSNRS